MPRVAFTIVTSMVLATIVLAIVATFTSNKWLLMATALMAITTALATIATTLLIITRDGSRLKGFELKFYLESTWATNIYTNIYVGTNIMNESTKSIAMFTKLITPWVATGMMSAYGMLSITALTTYTTE